MDTINQIFLNWSEVIGEPVILTLCAGFIVIIFTLVFIDRFY